MGGWSLRGDKQRVRDEDAILEYEGVDTKEKEETVN
jgi:hypothetical protein